MNRFPPHGGAPRGPMGAQPPRGGLHGSSHAPQGFGSQDARSNLAVQPSAPTNKIKLRKAAVKMVGAASSPTAPPAAPTPLAGAVQSEPKKEDGKEPPKPVNEAEPIRPQVSSPQPGAESGLDSLFSRLSTPSQKLAASPAASQAPFAPDSSTLQSEERSAPATPRPATLTASTVLQAYTANLPKESTSKPVASKEPAIETGPAIKAEPVIETEPAIKTKPAIETEPEIETEQAIKTEPATPESHKVPESPHNTTPVTVEKAHWPAAPVVAPEPNKPISIEDMTKEELERAYLQKASEYLLSLPTGGTTADVVKNVAIKLSHIHTPVAKLELAEAEKLKSRYVYAVQAHLNGKPGAKQVVRSFVQDILEKSDGNFLRLLAALVDEKLLNIDNMDDIVSLCKAILTILPKETKSETTSPATEKPASNDPVDKMTAWPTREKRENPPGIRSCMLKGVTNVKSINQLQALVWGGRLEHLSLPEPGSSVAHVRFLTAEACDKYFKATENGIQMPGEKFVIFVEKQPGPNSLNDVMRNCADGDASRCIRAYDADDDWSDMVLMKLARGKGQQKREVDRIKRGKTSRGRSYIEFRFASIYHSLNFRRALMDDEDWEHCTIGYAPDPCEIATGPHFKDEDEEEKPAGFF
ncbi:hypothetical protein CC80DRAFT_543054 [Byssothecium circinans]|uniref:Uncharacterized protein n=1 Tax=Byssothecium circinans TaxID=147558 RepID=A0A6A5U9S8_9PLEO|nr:hypothetical protein CC80DRAFT_543054 [Byssothecium circinans]